MNRNEEEEDHASRESGESKNQEKSMSFSRQEFKRSTESTEEELKARKKKESKEPERRLLKRTRIKET